MVLVVTVVLVVPKAVTVVLVGEVALALAMALSGLAGLSRGRRPSPPLLRSFLGEGGSGILPRLKSSLRPMPRVTKPVQRVAPV